MREVPCWDEYFLDIARTVATRSKDPDTQVGALIVGPQHEIRCTGYNSLPRGSDDTKLERFERPLKYLLVSHAERNAIYNAALTGTSLKDCILYVPWYPCSECSVAIVQAGIAAVIIDEQENATRESKPQWKESIERSKQLFREVNLPVFSYNNQTKVKTQLI